MLAEITVFMNFTYNILLMIFFWRLHIQIMNIISGLKRYKILSLVGDGTYGLVYMATNVETREKVAIKAMKRKYHSWDEVMDLREVKSLRKLHHPNVVTSRKSITSSHE